MTEHLTDLQTESRALGTILANFEEPVEEYIARLCGEDFTDLYHRSILQAMKRVMERKEDVDFISIAHELNQNPNIQDNGSYLAELTNYSVPLSSLSTEISHLKDLTFKRELNQSEN